MDPNEELLGADLTEHNIKHGHVIFIIRYLYCSVDEAQI